MIYTELIKRLQITKDDVTRALELFIHRVQHRESGRAALELNTFREYEF